jgi:hypothetical protein
MFARTIAPIVAQAGRRQPVLTVIGPRQSGKTTLVRQVFSEHDYVSLERPDERQFAIEDPRGFLARFPDPVILDEVQRAPDLLSYIQVAVDENAIPGRYVLTGSSNFLLMERVSQTLAGRTAILQLLPLTAAELFGRAPVDPFLLDAPLEAPEPPDPSVWATIWAGFYPRIHAEGIEPQRWLADYERTYVERDLRDVLKVLDLDAFHRFMRLAAARTGQELNLSALASDVGITQPTAKQWISALRVGFIVTLLQPHFVSFRKRLRRMPRLHFLDTGLACYLLGIPDAASLERHPLRGAIFESYIVAELMKAFENRGRDAPLFFWKDRSGNEVDILIDLGTRILPVEVKSSLTVPSDAFDGLRDWLNLPGNPNETGILVYGGVESYRRDPVTVLPWYLS